MKKINKHISFIFLIFIIISLVSIFTACEKVDDTITSISQRFVSEESIDSASDTVKEFFDLIKVRDLEKAYDYIYAETDPDKTYEDFIAEFDNITDIVSFDINNIEVKNNVAIVEVDLMDTYDEEEKLYKDIQVSLVKDEHDEWKINFWKKDIISINNSN